VCTVSSQINRVKGRKRTNSLSLSFSHQPLSYMSAQTRRVRGVSVYRPIIYGNSTTLLQESERQGTDHTHRWTVGIRSAASLARLNSHPNHQIGGADDLSYVTLTLLREREISLNLILSLPTAT